jgi:hypothetical protein
MLFIGRLLRNNYPEEFKVYLAFPKWKRRELLYLLDINRPVSIYQVMEVLAKKN